MELFVMGTPEMIEDDEPDILLPEQYNELRRRCHQLRGEMRLMFAVLEGCDSLLSPSHERHWPAAQEAFL
jgi:hypothetical protein